MTDPPLHPTAGLVRVRVPSKPTDRVVATLPPGLEDDLAALAKFSSEALQLALDQGDVQSPPLAHVPKVPPRLSEGSTVYYSCEDDRPPPSTSAPRRDSIPGQTSVPQYIPNDELNNQDATEPTAAVDDTPLEIDNVQDAFDSDPRPPIVRFRGPPKKPLSVTDLVSPAWCELQYFFALTKHGRKRQTAIMKQGTVVHKKLEDQVFEYVPVSVFTREDNWGLKIWNTIQGFRTLAKTGMTRELEIWGTVDGQIVNGIIDEISYKCPDEKLDSLVRKAEKARGATAAAVEHGKAETTDDADTSKKIYITDVKSRTSKWLPKGPALKPTFVQLMLYWRLLADLALDRVDPRVIFDRYRLNPSKPFSETFIDDVAKLDYNFKPDPTDGEDPFQASPDARSELYEHDTLHDLWALMIRELRTVIPSEDALGKVLHVEFRSQVNGSVIGSKSFVYNSDVIQRYVKEVLRGWRGERKPKGVEIEDAFKCRTCEFAEECAWRQNKIGESIERFRSRSTGNGKSGG